jgi:hypothetical protein
LRLQIIGRITPLFGQIEQQLAVFRSHLSRHLQTLVGIEAAFVLCMATSAG